MKTGDWFSFSIVSLCIGLAPWAGAQERADTQEFSVYSPSDSDTRKFSWKLRGRSDFSNAGREWVAELERAGIVNRSLQGPYRVAVPLLSFGHAGPKIMITYTRKLPGATGDGMLIFIHVPIP
ncbi:MAG: hypothetical protein A3I66_06270 [Burkholderiales bacterium RIFCSPLOWO2_02_FULL_57_36]|nr:MAG: hypothetical protein A3I66_06270 [Burkholderiales bacterium RIFCSPLOWO2_02_FULL_57_36]